jgi:hypothetical protein
MVSEVQKTSVLILGLFWAASMISAYYIHVIYELNLYWYTVLGSVLFAAIGLLMSSGRSKFFIYLIFFPFIASEKDLLKYKVEKMSIVMGAYMMAVSCTLLFISMSMSVVWIITCVALAYVFTAAFVLVSKSFKADVPSE